MKILILSSRFPYPTEKGDKLRLYHQIKFLSKNNEVYLFCTSHEKVEKEHKDYMLQYCKALYVFKINIFRSYFNALIALLSSYPSQVSFFYRTSISKKLKKLVSDIQPDIYYCQLLRMAKYLEKLNGKKTIDLMDAFSLSAQRRSKFENLIAKLFFSLEARKLAKYEIKMVEYFDRSCIISEADKNHIIENGAQKDIKIISNGIDSQFYTRSEANQKYELIFVGNMGYHPNILAAKYIIHKLLPKLKVKCLIAGARPAKELQNLSSSNVIISGWMEDIRDAYNSSFIFVAPIFSGAGQQNKILEAMSMELLCVTTPIVNQSIGAKPGVEILVAQSEEEFVFLLTRALRDKVWRDEIRKKGRKFIQERFSWNVENKKLEDILNS